MKQVQVMMSTYNGEKYLNEQIESLLEQDYKNIEILIRDDGSKDSTPQILQKWSTHPQIKIFLEENVGVVKSFFKLLTYSSAEAGYLAFSDQDDVWVKNKLSKAISMMAENEEKGMMPLLYSSTSLCVDEALNPLEVTTKPKHKITFENALVECITAGCTMVFNDAARALILRELPRDSIASILRYHDWWILQVVTAFGEVIFDDEPMICHRRHSNNVSGQEVGLAKWSYRLKKFLAPEKIVPLGQQAEEFKRIYGDILPKDKLEVLDRLIKSLKTASGRLTYAISGPTFRQSKLDDIIFRMMILMNKV